MAIKKATAIKKGVRKPAARSSKATSQKSEATPAQPAAPSPAVAGAWLTAVRAAEAKKASDIKVLDLREVTSFADFFVICSGTNPRQVQAIAEEIDAQLAKIGEKASNLEGYKNGEWVLADYGDMVVHVFSPKSREFYELERLWRHARVVEIPAE